MWEVLFIILLTLIVVLSGMPLAFAFGFVGVVVALIFGASGPLVMVASTLFESVNSFELLTIPLFILMGVLIANSPAGSDLYEAIHRFLCRLPGGLAMSNIWACAIFSAMCGSSPATAAAIGTAGIPEMRKRGIADSLAAGSIVGGGTLGILIPPSITLIIYGISTETNIGELFMAGIIPGIMMTLLFCLWALIQTAWSRHNTPVEQRFEKRQYTWAEKMEYVPRAIPFVLLITLIIVSIYGGVATPSEAAGLGAFGAVLLLLLIYRRSLNKEALRHIFSHVTIDTSMIMLVAASTVFYQSVLTDLYVTQNIVDWIAHLSASRWVLMLLINFLLLVMGCFLPPFAIILLVAPFLHPVIVNLGFDPIWFGIIVTINMEAGCITPPFGINLYVVKGIAPDMKMIDIMLGSLPFLLIIFLAIVILSIFPELATWLPMQMVK